MRVIFEEVDNEFFLEVILTAYDFEKIENFGGVIGNYVWENKTVKDLNVYIRKEKDNRQCHSSKERKQVAAKDSQRTSSEKFLKVSRKSKPLLSLIPKRVGGKKLLPKKKPTRKQPSNG